MLLSFIFLFIALFLFFDHFLLLFSLCLISVCIFHWLSDHCPTIINVWFIHLIKRHRLLMEKSIIEALHKSNLNLNATSVKVRYSATTHEKRINYKIDASIHFFMFQIMLFWLQKQNVSLQFTFSFFIIHVTDCRGENFWFHLRMFSKSKNSESIKWFLRRLESCKNWEGIYMWHVLWSCYKTEGITR